MLSRALVSHLWADFNYDAHSNTQLPKCFCVLLQCAHNNHIQATHCLYNDTLMMSLSSQPLQKKCCPLISAFLRCFFFLFSFSYSRGDLNSGLWGISVFPFDWLSNEAKLNEHFSHRSEQTGSNLSWKRMRG